MHVGSNLGFYGMNTRVGRRKSGLAYGLVDTPPSDRSPIVGSAAIDARRETRVSRRNNPHRRSPAKITRVSNLLAFSVGAGLHMVFEVFVAPIF